MTPDIPDLIAKLEQRLASLGDGRDCRSDNERADWWTATMSIRRTISGLRNGLQDLIKPTALLTECEERRAVVLAKQAELEKAITDSPDLRSWSGDGMSRDREAERQRQLQLALQRLREGRLLVQGVPLPAPEDLDARIKELTARRDWAQAALDAYVEQAEAWLGEMVAADGVAAR